MRCFLCGDISDENEAVDLASFRRYLRCKLDPLQTFEQVYIESCFGWKKCKYYFCIHFIAFQVH